MIKSRTKRRAAGLVAAAAMVVAAVAGSAAQATTPSVTPNASAKPIADSATTGIPALVDPAVDLGRHSPGPEPTWFDSIYFTSTVKADGHEFGLQVHTRAFPNSEGNTYRWTFSVTDKTTGWYKAHQVIIEPEDYHWSQGKLDITAPGLSWTGDLAHQAVRVTTPWGSLDVQLVPKGPALNYASTGVFHMVDVPNYEFALPQMRTSGTLVIGDQKHAITGTSWLDRQWGELPTTLTRWTWLNLDMPNGDKVAIWDAIGRSTEDCWATVLHRDGSYDVVAVEPLAQGASKPWTSPTSGQTYPTRWQVRIPALRAELKVWVTGTPGQEIEAGESGYLEATSAFAGTYGGKKVTGENYVEMIGDWGGGD